MMRHSPSDGFWLPRPGRNGVSWMGRSLSADLPPVVINSPALPLVSVVTPSYNQGEFIRATIQSVLTQDYPNIEYWVIDGASTDGTIDVLKDYEHDPRFNWISEKDAGQSDAVNKGWSRCRGEILAWLNSDDTYMPGGIRTQVEALLRHADCGIVYGDVLYVRRDGEPIYRGYGRPYDVIELLRLSIPAQPTTFIRRWVCEEVGRLNGDFRFSMDSEYWVRASKMTAFWYEPRCVATYRLHGVSKTVGGYRGFYREWTQIAEDFFSDPEMAAYREHRSRVMADIYSMISAAEVERGSLSLAFDYLLMALRMGGVRTRMFKLLPLLADRLLPLEITPRLVQWWTRRYSVRAAKGEEK
jgi:glycosyltransferase involved in cell wall biosynthesis